MYIKGFNSNKLKEIILLSDRQRKTLLCLMAVMNNKNKVELNITELSTLFGQFTNRGAVAKSIKDLEEKGIISIDEHRMVKISKEYVLSGTSVGRNVKPFIDQASIN